VQVEIDEYKDYEKALTALQQSQEVLNRVSNPKEHTVETLNKKIGQIKRFLGLRRFYRYFPKSNVSNRIYLTVHTKLIRLKR